MLSAKSARIVPGRSFLGYCCTHQITVLRNRAFALEALDRDGTAIMKSTKSLKKGRSL
jgi:hypothetical protein